jgi:hypothetical protein
MDNRPLVIVVNKDGTLRAHSCKISQVLSKEPDGPITHVDVYWYDDMFREETGNHHIIPIEDVLYQRGEPSYRNLPDREPELVVTRIAISEKLRNDVYERDGYKCRKCDSEKELSVDHIIPFSKNGRTEYDNLQTLCMACNRKKRASFEVV